MKQTENNAIIYLRSTRNILEHTQVRPRAAQEVEEEKEAFDFAKTREWASIRKPMDETRLVVHVRY